MHKKPKRDLVDRGYEPAHIEEVLTAIRRNFPRYWNTFAPTAIEKFREAITAWENERLAYFEFLDWDSLEEYEDDPNAFKRALASECPIIRRSLNSPQEEMKKYKTAFYSAKGRDLLTTTLNIVAFGKQHMQQFNENTHEHATNVDELGLSDLLEEDYGVFGAIGGGIRSQFLFALHPNAFPYRSRAGVWAMYFLSGKDAFGFDDDSEFLMIDVDKSSTQQNYFYPYDLFVFYGLNVERMLKNTCAAVKIPLRDDRRYVYLDAFFKHVHDQHQDEVKLLKGSPEDEYVD